LDKKYTGRDEDMRGCLLKNEKGATSVEYAFIASLIAAVIVGVVSTLGLSVIDLFRRATTGW
jgi:Flp pilus assembly pilin Flp